MTLDPIELASRVVNALTFERREASYKQAFALSLIYECTLNPETEKVNLFNLADHFIDLYWPLLDPFDGKTLVQARRGRARIPTSIAKLKSGVGHDAWKPGRPRTGPSYALARRQVAQGIAQMPATHFQPLDPGGSKARSDFLYDARWLHKKITLAELDAHSWTLSLTPGAARALVVSSSLLVPVIQKLWEEDVKAFNVILSQSRRLSQWLFGGGREGLHDLREPLRTLQGGRCFYCGSILKSDPHIDHVIPWSRSGCNDLSNLVAADPKCNLEKSDYLPSRETLLASIGRPYLGVLAAETGRELNPGRTVAIGEALIRASVPGTRLWARHGGWTSL